MSFNPMAFPNSRTFLDINGQRLMGLSWWDWTPPPEIWALVPDLSYVLVFVGVEIPADWISRLHWSRPNSIIFLPANPSSTSENEIRIRPRARSMLSGPPAYQLRCPFGAFRRHGNGVPSSVAVSWPISRLLTFRRGFWMRRMRRGGFNRWEYSLWTKMDGHGTILLPVSTSRIASERFYVSPDCLTISSPVLRCKCWMTLSWNCVCAVHASLVKKSCAEAGINYLYIRVMSALP